MSVSRGWPTSDGTIIYHKFVGQKFKEYNGEFYTRTDVYIRYQYSVNGISYTSLSIDSIDSPFYLYPSSYASQYPVGKDVIVYYNPNNPSDAVLEPGFVRLFKAFDVYSYLIFGAGIYYIFLGIARIKETRNRNRWRIKKKLKE